MMLRISCQETSGALTPDREKQDMYGKTGLCIVWEDRVMKCRVQLTEDAVETRAIRLWTLIC